jgi:formylmethanofuran dehydrogenase subunit E
MTELYNNSYYKGKSMKLFIEKDNEFHRIYGKELILHGLVSVKSNEDFTLITIKTENHEFIFNPVWVRSYFIYEEKDMASYYCEECGEVLDSSEVHMDDVDDIVCDVCGAIVEEVDNPDEDDCDD